MKIINPPFDIPAGAMLNVSSVMFASILHVSFGGITRTIPGYVDDKGDFRCDGPLPNAATYEPDPTPIYAEGKK